MSELNVRIKPKKSSAPGEIPATSELEVAELAVNTADGRLFTKHTDNSIVEIGSVSGGGLSEISQDGSPQLGGDLDVNGYFITSANGGDVVLAPNTTGDIILRGKGVSGAATVSFNTESNNQYIQVAAPENADLQDSYVLRLPTSPGLTGQTLITDGTGALSWAASIGNSIEGLNDVVLPETGALANQVLKFNGVDTWENAYVSYSELTDTPNFGTAAFSDNEDFASAAQGLLADSALQPGDGNSSLVNDAGYALDADLAVVAKSGDYNDLINTPAGIEDIGDVTNISIQNPENEDVLVYQDGVWLNRNLLESANKYAYSRIIASNSYMVTPERLGHGQTARQELESRGWIVASYTYGSQLVQLPLPATVLGVEYFGKPAANWFAYARGGLGFDAEGDDPILASKSDEQATNTDFLATLWAANLNVTHNTVAYRSIADGVIVRQELANLSSSNSKGFIVEWTLSTTGSITVAILPYVNGTANGDPDLGSDLFGIFGNNAALPDNEGTTFTAPVADIIDVTLRQPIVVRWTRLNSAGVSIDELSDVDTSTTTPVSGQALVWNAVTGQWVPGNVASGGGGGGSFAGGRLTVSATSENGLGALTSVGSSGNMTKIECVDDAWITFYVDEASRTADANRSVNTDPAPNTGIVGEARVLAGQAIDLTPPVTYWNNDDPVTSTLYFRTRNNSGDPINTGITIDAYPTVTELGEETASLGADGKATLTTLGSSGTLVKMQSSVDAWVSLYVSDATREADITRDFDTDPAPSSGVLGDFYLTAGVEYLITPAVNYFNGDTNSDSALYAYARSLAGTPVPTSLTVKSYVNQFGTGGGGGGTSDVQVLDDLEDVTASGMASFYQSFESSLPPEQVEDNGGGGSLSIEHARTGIQSFKMTEAYGGGYSIGEPFTYNSSNYDVISLWIYSSVELDTDHRQVLGGNKKSIVTGSGWTIYTRDTGFSFYANGSFTEFGTRPTIPANQWNNFIVQLHWGNGRAQAPTNMSIWVNGTLQCDADPSGIAYLPHGTSEDTARFIFAQSASTTDFDRWVDDVRVAQTTDPIVAPGTASINVSAVEEVIAQSTNPIIPGSPLVYDGNQWTAGTVDMWGLQLKDLSDVTYVPSGLRMTIDGVRAYGFAASDNRAATNERVLANSNFGTVLYSGDSNSIESWVAAYASKGVQLCSTDGDFYFSGHWDPDDRRAPKLWLTDHNPWATERDAAKIGFAMPEGLAEGYEQAYTLPSSDGTSGQVLQTDGSGQMSWVDPPETDDLISLTELKSVVADSTDFADFQSRIAAL